MTKFKGGPNLPEKVLDRRLDSRLDQSKSAMNDLKKTIELQGYTFQDYAGLIRAGRLPLESNLLGFLETILEFEHELKLSNKQLLDHTQFVNQVYMLFGNLPIDLKSRILNTYKDLHKSRAEYSESFKNSELPLKLRYVIFNNLESQDPETEVNLELPVPEQTCFLYLPKPSKIEIGVVKDGKHVIVLDKETLDSTIGAYEDYHSTKLDEDQVADLNELFGLELMDKFNDYFIKKLGLNLLKGNQNA